MAFSDEICQLVIENIELLEEAPNVIDEIQNKVFKEINNRFKKYFEGRDGWKADGVYTLLDESEDDGQTIFAPIGWPVDEDTNYTAYYSFDSNPSEDYQYWLTGLVGKTPLDKFGIFFSVEKNFMGMTKKQWKSFLQSQYQSKPILQESGVTYESGSLCIQIVIDPQLMADEYPDFDTCLNPVDEAIEVLMKVNPCIDEIVKEAMNNVING